MNKLATETSSYQIPATKSLKSSNSGSSGENP